MPDMLVKLYALPPFDAAIERVQAAQVEIRRGLVPEKHHILHWIGEHFRAGWVSEADVCFARHPVSCYIATRGNELAGFACYDATMRGFFGPTGVAEELRGQGIGTALLLACLHDMRAQGYGYAIIGAAGPVDYYQKACGAVPIPGSEPGIYAGFIDNW